MNQTPTETTHAPVIALRKTLSALTVAVVISTAAFAQNNSQSGAERPTAWKLMRQYAQNQRNLRPDSPPTRILHFPADRTMGSLSIKDADPPRRIVDFLYWIDGATWKEHGRAVGDVTVPAGKLVLLSVDYGKCRDLSPLSTLGPDDLYGLIVAGPFQGGPKPTDKVVPHFTHLTGLKRLDLSQTAISYRGIEQLLALKNLEYLTISDIATDRMLAQLASLPKLKGLYLQRNNVTNTGLAHLKNFPALEELHLDQGRMTDQGLIHLAACPRLTYLMLSGTNFTDYGMPYIKDIPSLKTLNAGHLSHLTDLGLKNVSTASQLEAFSAHRAQAITDAGLEHFTAMPNLKILDVKNAQITDVGAAHLAKIKTLEYLELSGGGISDLGMIAISKLTNLRSLEALRAFGGDPKDERIIYTDLSIKQIAARCTRIEYLGIGSIAMTDESVKAISTLPDLKHIFFFGTPAITGRGLAHLDKLTSLEHLHLYAASVTLADLAQLKHLPNLRRLDVSSVTRGVANLDLSSLPSLEEVSMSFERKTEDYFTDTDLAGLTNCKSLQWLQIRPRKYSDEGMDYIAQLPEMERVGVGGPMLTDAGIEKLTGLKKLNHLSINEGQFTDRTVRHLVNIPSLQYLFLNACPAFDTRAQNHLKSNLPALHSIRVDPAR